MKADPSLISEAIENLVLNATDASPDDVHVRIGYDSVRTSVFVAIEDRGPGIQQAHQPRAFDPGFTTRDGGNGYGLSICRRIPTAHRESIHLTSLEGVGTVVRFDLPIDFEVESDKEALHLQRRATEESGDPIAEEFIR